MLLAILALQASDRCCLQGLVFPYLLISSTVPRLLKNHCGVCAAGCCL